MVMFLFPHNVNEHATRAAAAWTVIICILGIVFREVEEMWYIIAGLGLEYALRVYGGGRFSLFGVIGEVTVLHAHQFSVLIKKPFEYRKLVPGTPKQFAAFCGLLFSTASAILLFCEVPIAGAVVLGILMFCAFLECVFNFCVGCFFWTLGNRFLPFFCRKKSVDEDNLFYDDMLAAAVEEDTRLHEKLPPRTIYKNPEEGERYIAYQYSKKTDEMRLEDFQPIKYVQINHFMSAMSIAGLSLVWKMVSDSERLGFHTRDGIYQAIVILAGVIWVLLFFLYVAKAIFYHHKVLMEWDHPVRSNAFSAVLITVLIFSYISLDEDDKLAEVLFWIAAPLQMFLAVIIVSGWIKNPRYVDFLNPSWLMAPVGNLVAAIVAPFIDEDLREVAWLWFSFALFMWVIMFTITLNQMITFGQNDDRIRPTLWIWLACPSVALLAYLSIAGVWDSFAKILFYIAVVKFFVLFWLTLRNYFGRNKWDMGYWAFIFPLDTFACALIQYDANQTTTFTRGLAWTAIVLATYTTGVFFFHTYSALVHLRIFVPDDKWGPISFMKVTHFAIKEACQNLVKLSKRLNPSPEKAEAFNNFKQLFADLRMVVEAHAQQEDQVYFPLLQKYFPEIIKKADQEHDDTDQEFKDMQLLIEACLGKEGSELETTFAGIKAATENLAESLVEHIETEEKHLQGIGRKWIPMEIQKDITRRMFLMISAEDWKRIIPWVITNNPTHGPRIRFLKALKWALPEYAQVIGVWIYPRISAELWERLIVDVPEIVPRNAEKSINWNTPAWSRYW